LLTNTC
jgi:hypothetical protein